MATASAPRRPATYEDLCAVPNHLVAEIVAGDLYTSPRPAPRHAVVSSRLGGKLQDPFDFGSGGPGGWWILDEPELHLGDDILVPDLAGWRKERMPSVPDVAYFSLVPDWICEIHSPSTRRLDRLHKLAIYGREGVRHAWLLDPDARLLEVFRLEGERWVRLGAHSEETELRVEPFDAVPLDLKALWP